jgi:hippurate hydrolase
MPNPVTVPVAVPAAGRAFRGPPGGGAAPWRSSRIAVAVALAIPALVAATIARAADAGPEGSDATIRNWTGRELPMLVQTYREFHAHPELSLHEEKTAARLAGLWRDAGLEVTEGVGGHGVVALLRNGSGPTVMLRTDLDGLPVTERTGLPFASTATAVDDAGGETGVMHACGHDVHMTTLVGVARFLAAHRPLWRGTAMFVGQPAEEVLTGAQAMLDDGLLTRFPRPEVAIAQHVDAALAAGTVGIRAGCTLANSDSVDITVRGRGGHGAYPHATVDPVVQAAELVLSLQAIVSREVPPTEPAVVTVGVIRGGTKRNVIADTCQLEATVRSYSDEVRELLLRSIERRAKAVAAAAGAPEPVVSVTRGVPALDNDPRLATRVEAAFRRVFGNARVVPAEQAMGAEDFSCFGRAGLPILMFRLGTVTPARLDRYRELGEQPPSLHSALFHPDAEPTLETGVTAMTTAALELLQ